MRNFLKMLSVLVISGTSAFSVVACNRCSTNNGGSIPPNNKPGTYNVSIKKIVTVDASNFYFDVNPASRYFTLKKDDMIDYSFTGDNPWNYTDIANVFVSDNDIWDKVASAYGFNRTTSKEDIKSIMSNTPIINVFFKYEYNANVNRYLCDLLDFQVK